MIGDLRKAATQFKNNVTSFMVTGTDIETEVKANGLMHGNVANDGDASVTIDDYPTDLTNLVFVCVAHFLPAGSEVFFGVKFPLFQIKTNAREREGMTA